MEDKTKDNKIKAEKMKAEKMKAALMVVVTDIKIHAFLLENDPMALIQCLEALDL